MHVQDDLLSLAIVVVVALLAGMALNRLRQPALVGYLLTGIVLGPSVLAVVENREQVVFLADLGILLLLFIVGMELSLRGFRAVWQVAVAAALSQIAIALAIMWAFSTLFGWRPETTVLLGFAVALSSTAVVIKLLDDLNLLRTQVGQLTVAVLIAQDLAIIPMILVLGLFTGADIEAATGGAAGVGESVAKIALSVAVLAALVIFLSRREKVGLPFMNALSATPELRPLYGTGLCFGSAAISGLLGLSTVYGAFIAGLIVGNSRARRMILHSVQPLQNILVMVFFVSIGLLIDLRFVADNIVPVLTVLLVVTVGKTVFNIAILLGLRQPWPHAFIAGLLLAQVGEFSLLLAAIGRSTGLIGEADFQLVITVTAFTLIVSPIWLATARRMLRVAVTRAPGVADAFRRIRIGGVRGMTRAVKGRPVPQGLAVRIFGRPKRPEEKGRPPPPPTEDIES